MPTAGPYQLVFDPSPGMAKAVAVALKSAAWPEVMGVLAEDDTLFVARTTSTTPGCCSSGSRGSSRRDRR